MAVEGSTGSELVRVVALLGAAVVMVPISAAWAWGRCWATCARAC